MMKNKNEKEKTLFSLVVLILLIEVALILALIYEGNYQLASTVFFLIIIGRLRMNGTII